MELVLSMTLMYTGHKAISLQDNVKNSGGPSMEIGNDREQSSIVIYNFIPSLLFLKIIKCLPRILMRIFPSIAKSLVKQDQE